MSKKSDQRWRSRKRAQLRKQGYPEEEVMRLVPPGYMSLERKARTEDSVRCGDCPDWFREMYGDDAYYLWIAGPTDIGDK